MLGFRPPSWPDDLDVEALETELQEEEEQRRQKEANMGGEKVDEAVSRFVVSFFSLSTTLSQYRPPSLSAAPPAPPRRLLRNKPNRHGREGRVGTAAGTED